MKVGVLCEFSATVRDAFLRRGHDAWSVDLLETTGDPSRHLRVDALSVLDHGWDLLLAFPPCTHLAVSGARWWPEKRADGRQQTAVTFFKALWGAPVQKMAVENPVGFMNSHWRKPDQIIQPWQFGHGEVKSTCLWLRGLPLLEPTDVVEGRRPRVWLAPDSLGRAMRRSITYRGIADAMARQWGSS